MDTNKRKSFNYVNRETSNRQILRLYPTVVGFCVYDLMANHLMISKEAVKQRDLQVTQAKKYVYNSSLP